MCIRDRVKTEENDGYSAVQVGFVDKKEKGINKPQKGHFDKAGVAPVSYTHLDVYKRQIQRRLQSL